MSRDERACIPLNLYRLTRHPSVSVADVQRAAGVTGVADNHLVQVARGRIASVRPGLQRKVERALRAMGLERDDWFAPMPADQAARLRATPRKANRRGGGPMAVCRRATDGAAPLEGHLTFRRFTQRGWDHWKKEPTPMLPIETLERFGLARDPFARVERPEDILPYAPQQRMRKALVEGLLAGEHLWLIGPSGSGKTINAREVVADLARTRRMAVARIKTPNNARASEYSITSAMTLDFADALGRAAGGGGNIEIQLRRLARMIAELAGQGRPCALVVEEGHCLRDHLIRYLRRLQESLSAEGLSRQALAILVIGQNDASARAVGRSMDDMLADPTLREVTRRVVPIHVGPLPPQTAARYVQHRIEAAGGRVEKIYAGDWQAATRSALRGSLLVPQAINALHSRAMQYAFDLNDTRLRPEHIADAAAWTPAPEEDA